MTGLAVQAEDLGLTERYTPEEARGTEATVIAALGVVSVLNYAYSLILVWILPTSTYAVVASASALLLICGTISSASLPWVLAREVAIARSDPERRQAAVAFCAVGTIVEAGVAGLATTLVAIHYASGFTIATILGSVVAIFTAATTVGYLQGQQRFKLIALLRVAEVIVKIGSGVALVELGTGAGGALAGFAFGAAIVAAVGLLIMAPDLHLLMPWRIERALWRNARGLMAIQAGVAVLSSLDVVVASIVVADRSKLATYQVAQLLTRVPIFIATALSMVAFPRLTVDGAAVAPAVRNILRLFVSITLPVAIATATLPNLVANHVFPNGYGGVVRLLAWGAAGGLFMGTINLVTTFFQARLLFARATAVLAAGVTAQVGLVVLGLKVGGVLGLAVCVAIGSFLVAATLVHDLRRRWPGCTTGVLRHGVIVGLVASPLVLLRNHLLLWGAWLAVGAAAPALVSLLRFRHDPIEGRRRPRVLHLGYEDHRRPGAGGGSARNHAINKRLAGAFDITVVCARFPGAQARVEDGVRYEHIGLPLSYFPSLVAYFVSIPLALWRFPSDLVVEDFAAPCSSVAVPWLTARPVVGVVQWLFAHEKSEQYHFPFHLIESCGLRSHRRLVAVSDDLGATLRSRNPRAEVSIVANGLEEDAFAARAAVDRRHVVFLGRLETAQKGLDILLAAFAGVVDRMDCDLLIGGDGPDADTLRTMAEDLGIGDRVRFLGRVAPDRRLEFLARAALVAMPSRYETFGMVAAEALAVGTPVLAFDIPCLRSLVTADNSVIVAGRDAGDYGKALAGIMVDHQKRSRLSRAGAASVAHLRWDRLAAQQGDVYRRALDG
jgi:glycosyltransferase involved in cell wall biosynthesis